MSATADKSTSYVEIGRIAQGGLGVVEMVLRREGEFERVYAMKRPHPHLLGDANVRKMFVQEAKLAGLLQHPNVVGVLDVGEDARGPFLLMDYIEGLSLQEVIRHTLTAGDLLPLSVVVQVGMQAAKGLQAAHGLIAHDGTPTPLVHRDVSPQNLLVGFDGVVRVADFGIAKALGGDGATTTHMLKGKTGYMAPEQLRFEGVDHRADLFALGVVLFEAAAGRRLYKGASLEQVAQKILHEPPPELASYRGDADPGLERVLMELLVKDRDTRVPDAKTLVERLAKIRHRMFGTEEWVELSDYMNTELAHRRDEIRSRRATALESTQSALAISRSTQTTGSSHAWLRTLALLTLLLVGVGIAYAVWPSAPAEPAETVEPQPAAQPDEEAPVPTMTEVPDVPADPVNMTVEPALMRATMMRRRSRTMRTSEMMSAGSAITSMWWD